MADGVDSGCRQWQMVAAHGDGWWQMVVVNGADRGWQQTVVDSGGRCGYRPHLMVTGSRNRRQSAVVVSGEQWWTATTNSDRWLRQTVDKINGKNINWCKVREKK